MFEDVDQDKISVAIDGGKDESSKSLREALTCHKTESSVSGDLVERDYRLSTESKDGEMSRLDDSFDEEGRTFRI